MNYDIGAKGRGSRNSREDALPTSRLSKPIPGLDAKLYKELSDGYLRIVEPMWTKIPQGAYIKYLRKDDGSGKTVAERFKSGGYVKSHSNKDNKAIIWLESIKGGSKSGPGYLNYPVLHTAVESLWKKHNADTQIETLLTHASLAEKSQQIKDLTARVAQLEAIINKK